ncbi:hypothetical protein DFH08DRAFT_940360 [Mycena albidolilacea]|uniref:Uncharacterized protein n=1 Tax=Mycena albidolilacea TaxID=1033008 RepID=A0AAD6ZMX0_9AGAR|nr:hypothetical protein DFH08DRAFT_940360 [Mycena albidolilacea]
MANAGTLAAARQCKSQRLAEDKAKGITVSTKSSSPLSTVLSLSDSEQPLHFPDSPTTMATPSDDDLPSSIPLPPTGSKRKSGSGVLSDDESDFAPEPARKKCGHWLMGQSDSEVEEVVQKPPKKPGPKPKSKVAAKAKPAKKRKALLSDTESVEMVEKEKPAPSVVLMVPEATSEGSQCLSIKTTILFEDALKLIHETIGCVSVVQKPTLTERLGGLVTDVTAKAKTKKDVSIVISVFPDNYMLSLCAMTKKKPAAPTKKKGKMTIMDLNNDDSAGEDDNDEGVADAEKKAMAELNAEYCKCMRCGPTYVCKIDRSGTHIHLSFNQHRAWAVSLACRTNNVTKTTPLQGDLFTMFHRKAKDGPVLGVVGPPAQYNPYFPYTMPPLFGGSLPGYHPHPPAAPQLPSSSAIHPQLSSDLPEEDVSYPSITDFVARLILAVPQREGLCSVGETLDSLHFYQIDEIVALTVDELGTERFGFVVPGDATYLLDKVRREVKQLDKMARHARRS